MSGVKRSPRRCRSSCVRYGQEPCHPHRRRRWRDVARPTESTPPASVGAVCFQHCARIVCVIPASSARAQRRIDRGRMANGEWSSRRRHLPRRSRERTFCGPHSEERLDQTATGQLRITRSTLLSRTQKSDLERLTSRCTSLDSSRIAICNEGGYRTLGVFPWQVASSAADACS
jgi:hypothetical protein